MFNGNPRRSGDIVPDDLDGLTTYDINKVCVERCPGCIGKEFCRIGQRVSKVVVKVCVGFIILKL